MSSNSTVVARETFQCKRDDAFCQDKLGDSSACCLKITLLDVPSDPTSSEMAAIQLYSLQGLPSVASKETHTCMKEADWKALKSEGDSDDWQNFYLLGKDYSKMHYKAYCDMALKLTVTALTFVSLSHY